MRCYHIYTHSVSLLTQKLFKLNITTIINKSLLALASRLLISTSSPSPYSFPHFPLLLLLLVDRSNPMYSSLFSAGLVQLWDTDSPQHSPLQGTFPKHRPHASTSSALLKSFLSFDDSTLRHQPTSAHCSHPSDKGAVISNADNDHRVFMRASSPSRSVILPRILTLLSPPTSLTQSIFFIFCFSPDAPWTAQSLSPRALGRTALVPALDESLVG